MGNEIKTNSSSGRIAAVKMPTVLRGGTLSPKAPTIIKAGIISEIFNVLDIEKKHQELGGASEFLAATRRSYL
jgi:hypothetical protein